MLDIDDHEKKKAIYKGMGVDPLPYPFYPQSLDYFDRDMQGWLEKDVVIWLSRIEKSTTIDDIALQTGWRQATKPGAHLSLNGHIKRILKGHGWACVRKGTGWAYVGPDHPGHPRNI